MKVIWQVDDGYAGGSAPQYTIVDDDELAECETEEGRQEVIREYVQSDFECTITWYITGTEE